LPNGIEDGFESSVVFLLERVQLAGERFIRGEHPAKPDERSHDGDVDLNRTGTSEDAGEHGDALFGECIRGIAATAPTAPET